MFLEPCGRRRETGAARQGVSALTSETEQPNKAIREHLSLARDCFTAKFHLFPLPPSLHIAVSIC